MNESSDLIVIVIVIVIVIDGAMQKYIPENVAGGDQAVVARKTNVANGEVVTLVELGPQSFSSSSAFVKILDISCLLHSLRALLGPCWRASSRESLSS